MDNKIVVIIHLRLLVLIGCLTLKETFNQPPHRLAPTCGTISAGGHALEINRFNTNTYAHIIDLEHGAEARGLSSMHYI